jgi:argininosuccinate lyase
MKGLPLAYSKDMQEDKEPLFDALGSLSLALAAMTGMVSDITPDKAAMREAAARGYATATDLADRLVMHFGLPFREAHHVTGKLVALAEKRRVDLNDLTLADLKAVHKGLTPDLLALLTVEKSVASRRSFGGTAPTNVAHQARRWLKALA